MHWFERDHQQSLAGSTPDGSSAPITRYTGGPELQRKRGDGMHPNRRAGGVAAAAIKELLEADPSLLSGDR